MKIGLAMKSNFAYERLHGELLEHEVFQIHTFEDIQEAIQYTKPDLVVLDQQVSFFSEAEMILLKFNIHIIFFESDFNLTIEQIKTQSVFFEEEPEPVKYIPDQRKYEKQYQEKVEVKQEPQIIYKEKVVEKEVERISFTSIPSKLIVIGSLWSGAGSTTVATNLARAIARRGVQVAYIEHPTMKPYMFDYLNIHNNEEKSPYIDQAQLLKKKRMVNKGAFWNEQGVTWVVNDSRHPPIQKFDYEEMLKLVYSVPMPIKIVDISNMWDDVSIREFLHQADEVYVCIEPDPVKIDWLAQISTNGEKAAIQREEYESIEFLNELEKKEGISYQYITTRLGDHIKIKEWHQNFVLKESLTTLKDIPYTTSNFAKWNSTLLYTNEQYSEMFEVAFKPILKKVLPQTFIKLETKEGKKKMLNNILNKIGKK